MATTMQDHGVEVVGRTYGLHTLHWQQADKGCRCGSALVYVPRDDGMAADGEVRRICLDCGEQTVRQVKVVEKTIPGRR